MFLKSLELAGFKSFARPTRLEFLPGITALVGANGSGKSNVVDAIRWCLGEQNARDLRGQRSEDVIYAGPRRVLGSAEVNLTFESNEGETEWAELGVSRRLYRSGESEYLVNGDKTRLRDVQTTLRTVGIDNPRFLVVTQGMTDVLLSATPAERRALLEQAAGLSGYRQRRDEAAHKLEAAERNIGTIEIVLAELEPRLRALRRQVRAVEEREEVQARLREALLGWYAWRRSESTARVERLSQEAAVAALDRRQAADDLNAIEETAEESLQRERAWQASMESASAALHLTEREREAARHEIERLSQRIEGAEANLRSFETRRSDLDEELPRAMARAADAAQGLRSLGQMERTLREQLAERRQDLTAKLEQKELAESAEVEWRRALTEHQQQQGEVDTLRKQLDERIDRLRRRESEIDEWLQSSVERQRDLERGGSARREEAEAAARIEQDAISKVARSQALALERQSRVMRLRTLRERLTSTRSHLASHLAAAERQAAVLEDEMHDTPIDRLDVAEGWELAIAAALDEWHSGVETALPEGFNLWREALADAVGDLGRWADDLVMSARALPSALYGTLLVEDPSLVEALWRRLAPLPAHQIGSPTIQIVARDGTGRSAGGCSHTVHDLRAAAYLRARREAKVTRRRLATSQQRLSRVRDAEGEAHEAADHASSTLQEQRSRSEDAHRQRATCLAEADTAQYDLDILREKRERSRTDRADLESELSGLFEQTDDLESRFATREREIAVVRRELADAEAVLAARSHEVSRARDALAELEQSLQVVMARGVAQREVVRLLSADENRVRADAHRQESEAHGLSVDIEAAASRREIELARANDLDQVQQEQARRLEELRGQRPSADDVRARLRDLRARCSDTVARHERLSAHLTEAQAECRRISDELRVELAIEVEQLPSDLEHAPDEFELRRLRNRAAHYAEADASVMDEYRELEERQSYLSEQLRDLRAASDGLHEIMRVADREMRVRFQSALSAVSKEFSRVLDTMLCGAHAELRPSDDDGGIEVHAALPDRRVRSSAAFSGGERALVASALLFGVLRIRPTPFVVLDEVDAALDETNVDRYLKALREIAQNTQVITVTHNRATMVAADALYGLTMDGDGQSGLLSLRLDQYEAVG